MSLEQAVAQGDVEVILDNAELALEEQESPLYTDTEIRQKVRATKLFVMFVSLFRALYHVSCLLC